MVHRNVMRVAGVAQALRSFARQSTGERRPVDLNTVVGETLLLVGKSMSTEDVRITTALDPALPSILGDANALQQVLLNLLTNAREALTGGGEISIQKGAIVGKSFTLWSSDEGDKARDEEMKAFTITAAKAWVRDLLEANDWKVGGIGALFG